MSSYIEEAKYMISWIVAMILTPVIAMTGGAFYFSNYEGLQFVESFHFFGWHMFWCQSMNG
jgi:hypothetical protein